MTEIIGRLWTSRKHHEWWCLSYLNLTGQNTPLKDWITRRICGYSVTKSYPTLCDSMDCSTPGFPDLQYLPEFAQTHVLLSFESVMPSNYLILCCPFLFLPSIFPSIWVFSNESALHIRWPKFWFNTYTLPEDLCMSFQPIDIICWIKSSKQLFYLIIRKWKWNHSVVSDYLQSHGL